MLELRNVSKRFPATLAVDNVSFQARAGEVTGYLGPERVRQVDHHEDDHRAHRDHVRQDLL